MPNAHIVSRLAFLAIASAKYYDLSDVNKSIYVGGFRAILTDQNKLVVAVGGVTALAAGIYTTRY